MLTNEAGILLMHKDLQKYIGSAAVISSAGASDFWLLAPDFCSGDERSRNIIDVEGHPDLSRTNVAKGERIRTRSRHLSEVSVTSGKLAVTSGKVPVTPAAASELVWQARMYKGINSLIDYVACRDRGQLGFLRNFTIER